MNRHHFDSASGTLFLYFYSDLVGAEFDEAIFSAFTAMAPMPWGNITGIVADLRDITGADLSDTDRARVAFFEASMQQIMEITEAEFKREQRRLKIIRIIDLESEPGRIFEQRLIRTNGGASVNRHLFVTSLEEAAEHSQLAVDFIEENLSALA